MDSAKATVNAYDPRLNAQILVDPAIACNSLNANFTVTTPPGFKYQFYFGDGSIDSTQQNEPRPFLSAPGNFLPSLTDRLTNSDAMATIRSQLFTFMERYLCLARIKKNFVIQDW